MNYGLGRIAHPDPRDHQHLMAERFDVVPVISRRRPWKLGQRLDQGQTPRCVGYGSRGGILDASPIMDKPDWGVSADQIYLEANANDEWSPTPHDGTSVRAGAKVLQKYNIIGEYVWAFDEPTVRKWVTTRGPVVLGTDWYEGMFNPRKPHYVLELTGSIAGGHCWFVYWYSALHDWYYMANSWGDSWADKGTAKIMRNDLARLIAQQGEALTTVELKHA